MYSWTSIVSDGSLLGAVQEGAGDGVWQEVGQGQDDPL